MALHLIVRLQVGPNFVVNQIAVGIAGMASWNRRGPGLVKDLWLGGVSHQHCYFKRPA